MLSYLSFEKLEKKTAIFSKKNRLLEFNSVNQVFLYLTIRGAAETDMLVDIKNIFHSMTLNTSYGNIDIKLAFLTRKKKKVLSSELLAVYHVHLKNFLFKENIHNIVYDFLCSTAAALNASGIQIYNVRCLRSNSLEFLLRNKNSKELIKLKISSKHTYQKESILSSFYSNEVFAD